MSFLVDFLLNFYKLKIFQFFARFFSLWWKLRRYGSTDTCAFYQISIFKQFLRKFYTLLLDTTYLYIQYTFFLNYWAHTHGQILGVHLKYILAFLVSRWGCLCVCYEDHHGWKEEGEVLGKFPWVSLSFKFLRISVPSSKLTFNCPCIFWPRCYECIESKIEWMTIQVKHSHFHELLSYSSILLHFILVSGQC